MENKCVYKHKKEWWAILPNYDTGCGTEGFIEDRTYRHLLYKYCPFCGKEIEESDEKK